MPANLYIDLKFNPSKDQKPFNGRDVQGALLSFVSKVSPELAEAMHEGGGHRLWASSLEAQAPGRASLRLGLLRDDDVTLLTRRLPLCPIEHLRLGAQTLAIERVRFGIDPSEHVLVENLGDRFLAATRLDIRLLSPLFFRDGGHDLPDVIRLAPSPERILSSVLAKVRALDLKLPGKALENPHAFISEYDMELRMRQHELHFSGGRRKTTQRGLIGRLIWDIRAEGEEKKFICALLDLLRFSGAGSRVTMGMGSINIFPYQPKSRRRARNQ